MNWLTSNSRPRPLIHLHVDLDEGRVARGFACLGCRGVADDAEYSVAMPAAMYVASLDCVECGEQLVAFDAFKGYVVRHDGQQWRAA